MIDIHTQNFSLIDADIIEHRKSYQLPDFVGIY